VSPIVGAVIDDDPADGRSAAGDELRAGKHLQIDAEVLAPEKVQRSDGRIRDQQQPMLASDRGKGPDVGDLELRVGDRLEENGSCPVVDQRLDGLGARKVGIAFSDPRAQSTGRSTCRRRSSMTLSLWRAMLRTYCDCRHSRGNRHHGLPRKCV
jgi:hypothetical protein